MGSDSILKSHHNIVKTSFHYNKQTITTRRSVILSLLSLFILGLTFFPSTYQSSSSTKITDIEIATAKGSIPKQCHKTLNKVIKCQNQDYNTNKETIIFACHRKWCNSFYGHCEKVNGIGDRTKHMLSMFSDASLDKCLKVEIDYPQTKHGIELRFTKNMVYNDPWGIIAEIFHFRSYDVSDLKVDVTSWGKMSKEKEKEKDQKSTSSSSS